MKKILFIVLLLLITIAPVKALPLPVEVTADSVLLMNLDTEQIINKKNLFAFILLS